MKLYIPNETELGFRAELLSDPEAMSYNRGYDLAFEGYHPDTGCIDFPPGDRRGWYEVWIENARENGRFYAYVEHEGAFVGDVCLHSADGGRTYELGVLIAPEYRGTGLSGQALRLLADYAFGELGAEALTNRFERKRKAAVRLHLSAGFTAAPDPDDPSGETLLFTLRRPEP